MNDEVFEQSYEIWRQHPMTTELIKLIKKHKDTMLKQACDSSIKADVTEMQIRQFLYGANTCEALLKVLTNYQSFKTLSTTTQ